jgi:hypothetical protein
MLELIRFIERKDWLNFLVETKGYGNYSSGSRWQQEEPLLLRDGY